MENESVVVERKKLVRMEWEQSYVESLIEALAPSGEVLEVGFCLGHSADCIQTYPVKHHTIIESDPQIAAEAVKWARKRSNVLVIHDLWQNVLPKLGHFDAIFFNDWRLESVAETLQSQEIGNLTLKKGKEVLAMASQKFPHLKRMQYSDQDIEMLYQKVGRLHLVDMANFLCELKNSGQILEEQFEKAVRKYKLQKEATKAHTCSEGCVDNTFTFLKNCYENHMLKGCRFSCFSMNPASKYEDPQFFDQIITDSDFEYEEKLIPVAVPESCEYYKHNEALIISVKKMV